jgi:CheY-like chemotaxis protein
VPKGIERPTPNLLVVDGDATVRQQLKRLYVQSGYSVVAVGSA